MERLISDHGGIKIGNRRLNYMAYSNSQIKSKAFWFLCENDPILIQQERGGFRTIAAKRISRMGAFDQERNALKRFARIGQLFSASSEICELERSQVKDDVLEDIKRNNHCFTDGVGSMSPLMAIKVA